MLKLKQTLAAASGAVLVTLLASAPAHARRVIPTPSPIPPLHNVAVISAPAVRIDPTGSVRVDSAARPRHSAS